MYGMYVSDERLYISIEYGGWGVKNFNDVYEDTKIKVAC